MRLLFLVLIFSSASCQLIAWKLRLTNFIRTVNVIRGNDLSYDACKKVQERPYSGFPAKDENILTHFFNKKLLYKKFVLSFLANNNRNTIGYCSHDNREKKK